jgi:hypothetical protein
MKGIRLPAIDMRRACRVKRLSNSSNYNSSSSRSSSAERGRQEPRWIGTSRGHLIRPLRQ